MNKKVGHEDFTASQFAIKGYIDFKDENIDRHRARVPISSNGENRFNDIVYIHAGIDTNYSFVQIEGNRQFERDFYDKYTNEYQRFRLIRGTLVIQANDIWGNGIEINITGV